MGNKKQNRIQVDATSAKHMERKKKWSKPLPKRALWGLGQRLRWPRKNTWEGFVGLEKFSGGVGKLGWYRRYYYRIPAVGLPVLLLISWCLMYWMLSQSIGAVRLNSFLLDQAIVDGTAKQIQGIGTDGSLTGIDGAVYASGSYTDKAVVTASFGWPYYAPAQKMLLVPYDWHSVFVGGLQMWILTVFTMLCHLFDKAYVRSLLPLRGSQESLIESHHQAIFEFTPRSIRLVRWAVVVVMIFCIGFMLWPLQ